MRLNPMSFLTTAIADVAIWWLVIRDIGSFLSARLVDRSFTRELLTYVLNGGLLSKVLTVTSPLAGRSTDQIEPGT